MSVLMGVFWWMSWLLIEKMGERPKILLFGSFIIFLKKCDALEKCVAFSQFSNIENEKITLLETFGYDKNLQNICRNVKH